MFKKKVTFRAWKITTHPIALTSGFGCRTSEILVYNAFFLSWHNHVTLHFYLSWCNHVTLHFYLSWCNHVTLLFYLSWRNHVTLQFYLSWRNHVTLHFYLSWHNHVTLQFYLCWRNHVTRRTSRDLDIFCALVVRRFKLTTCRCSRECSCTIWSLSMGCRFEVVGKNSD